LQLKLRTDLWHVSYVMRSRVISWNGVLDATVLQVFFCLFIKYTVIMQKLVSQASSRKCTICHFI